MRLFIGIELPPEMIRTLTACQRQIRIQAVRGRFKRPDNFHLTLKFLGEVADTEVDRLVQPLAAAAKAIGPLELQLGKLGCFGQGNPLRVVWLGVAGQIEGLTRLQEEVEQAMARQGFARERRKWRPHITLAQDVEFAAEDADWRKATVQAAEFTVGEFALISSAEQDGKRVYTPLHRFMLD